MTGPRYWECTAGHNHLTPAAAARCSSQQPSPAVYWSAGGALAFLACLVLAGLTGSLWWFAVALVVVVVVGGAGAQARHAQADRERRR